ncbi:uncharacterized protein [Rutidosis leptorrhynchoides]|uniref:uncharacterized protein n=1 Tax=Rutidosis leptorrhynchoides TaxID=125765 RepID=UPI003A998242
MKLYGKSLGEDLKERGIAVDVVNFCQNDNDWIPGLKELVDAADNNSQVVHVEPTIWTLARDVLSSIIPGACSLEEEERRCLEANKPPNTNDAYDNYSLELTAQLKKEYMEQGLVAAAQNCADLEKRVLEARKLEHAKHDPRELLRLILLEEEDNTTIPELELVSEEKKSKRKRNRKRKPQLQLVDNNSILKTPPGVAAAERGGYKHSLLMYMYDVYKTTHHNNNIMNLYIKSIIYICGCLLATYWVSHMLN